MVIGSNCRQTPSYLAGFVIDSTALQISPARRFRQHDAFLLNLLKVLLYIGLKSTLGSGVTEVHSFSLIVAIQILINGITRENIHSLRLSRFTLDRSHRTVDRHGRGTNIG